MTRKMALLAGLLGCITPTMLYAQETAAPSQAPRQPVQQVPSDADLDTEVEGIVVTGQRQYGAVLGDIQPETTFNAADVRSLGVSSVTELLSELSAQTASASGGSPVTLLNGRRISGMGEIRDIPTEAIQRVEILPEEVALKYGYSADQKVVNIVLRQRFRARTGEISVAAPTDGGQTTEQIDSSTLRLNRQGRLNTAFKYAHSDKLLESDRDIGPSETDAAFDGDVSNYRTLKPRTDSLSYNAVYNRVLENGVSATVNGSLSYDQSQSLQGLSRARLTIPANNPFYTGEASLNRYLTDLGAMEQWNRSWNAHGGFTLDGALKSWRWNLTGNYDHDESRTSSDRDASVLDIQRRLDALDPTLDPYAGLPTGSFLRNTAHSISDTINTQLVMNGALTRLPAGDLSTTVKLGVEGAWTDSWSRRSNTAGVTESSADLSRGTANAQVSFDLPITSRRNNFMAKAGDLSANLNLSINQLSDFGTLTTIGGGLNWSPIKPVSFIVSGTRQENAPSMSQLGAPLVTTTSVRVFDYVKGESVEVNRISGGNPDLKSEERNVFKVGFTVKPPQIEGLAVNGNYTRTRIDNPIASFPSATAAIEAAFPDRFTRADPTDEDTDGIGRLISIDSRSVNFAKRESEQFRWGFNYSRQIGKTPPRPTPTPEEMQRWRERQGQGESRRGQGDQAAGGQRSQASQAQGQTQVAEGAQPPGMDLLQGAMRQGGEQRGGGDNAQPPSDGPRPGGDQGGPGAGPGGGFGGPGGGFGGRGPGGFGGPGGPGGLGAARLQLALFHTVRLREQVYIFDGAAPLDLLEGDALGNSGGTPRNEVEAQLGFTKQGMGARLTANWKEGTQVTGGTTGTSTGTLRFSDLTTVNLRLFANLGARRELVAKYPVLRGTRVTFGVTNLFDQKQTVRDATGEIPTNYAQDYLDPLGRSVRLSVRKVFF
ncbi:TonB-dependent receptor [Caulobacter flavus]|nr:TonB-dependent receptor [Caulobacter flavus]